MDYITVTAKNLDDAITEALVQLEVQVIVLIMKLSKKEAMVSLDSVENRPLSKPAEKKSL